MATEGGDGEVRLRHGVGCCGGGEAWPGCLCARYHARGRPEQAWAPAGLVLRAVEAEVEVQPEG